jgi:hypothetical protein
LCGGLHFGYNSYYPDRYSDFFRNFLGLTDRVDGTRGNSLYDEEEFSPSPPSLTGCSSSIPEVEPVSLTTDCTSKQETETNKNIIHLTTVIADLSTRNNELLERLSDFEEEKQKALEEKEEEFSIREAAIRNELSSAKERKKYYKAKCKKKQGKIFELLVDMERQKKKLQKWETWHSSFKSED